MVTSGYDLRVPEGKSTVHGALSCPKVYSGRRVETVFVVAEARIF
jgi:hypothetical protein